MPANLILTSTENAVDADQPKVTGSTVGLKHGLDVALVGGSPLSGVAWDYLDVQQTSSTVETYVFKTGGSGGTTVATCVVTYTSSAKTDLDTVEWS